MKLPILILGLAIIGIGGVIFALTKGPWAPKSFTIPPPAARENAFAFPETEFDFGTVKQSGGPVTRSFPFTYRGGRDITIQSLPTSCGCTSAQTDVKTLASGTQGTITVTFDPNLHAEPSGRFYKTVTLLTDPPLTDSPELKIWAQVDLDLGPKFYKEQSHEGKILLQTENLTPEKDYSTIRASTLKEAMEDKHFFLVDVHTPEQTHIKGTDAVIPFDQLKNRTSELPQNKDETIVLYCRSGGMSQQAAQTLADLGYTNVYHVQGGIQAYNELQ